MAIYLHGRMEKACYVRNPERSIRGPAAWLAMAQATILEVPKHVHTLVLEVPQVYRGPRVDPADLIELAGVDGALTSAVLADKSVGFLPREWKGQVPKEIHHERVLKKLTADELSNMQLPAASLVHNVMDAVALGLFYVEKTGDRKAGA